MKKACFFLTSMLFIFNAEAVEQRNYLQKEATLQQVKESIVSPKEWVSYPDYTNRAGWDTLTGSLKKEIITEGEKALKYEWKPVKATDYLLFERTGDRATMETIFGNNSAAFSRLVFAELAEGKGRFMDQIIDGIWYFCEMSSWASPAHLGVQKSRRALPDFREEIIELASSDMGSFFSWTWYFLHAEMDKINPVIAQKLRNNIQSRMMDPYMARDDYWWQALGPNPGVINNWNPWCNSNILICFLLLEENADKRAAAVYKTMKSIDQFINYVKEDGACEEGPSYWGHAGGKLYDYLQLLSNASRGKLNIFDKPMIRNIGEYIGHSYVGNGWVANFADASAKGGGEAGLIYRFGKATGSKEMQQFAAYLVKSRDNAEVFAVRDFFRTVENLASYNALLSETPALPAASYTWYPQTEFLYERTAKGLFFAAKAGFNNESHNHNDVGTFNLYINETPFFIDAGVGTYTRQTFSSERYTIWTMQSNYHNLPMVNGKPQQFGGEFKAKQVKFDPEKKRFSLDMSGAYTKDAAVKTWVRNYTLTDNTLTIEDTYELAECKAPSQLNFLSWGKPVLVNPGIVLIEKEGKSANLAYDANMFTATVETIPQTDKRLSNVWGNEVYRIVLLAKYRQLRGKYRFIITKNDTK